MSGNVEDEARARLDVAQLYEDMGQNAKAVRYYLEAAQIYKDGKVFSRAKELLNKVLKLEPGNAAAEEELAKINGPSAAAAPTPAASTSASGEGAVPAAKPKTSGSQLPPLQLPKPQPGKVLVPTPWLFRDPRYVASAKKQITAAVERERLNYDPLPKVDAQMVMLKQEQRKKAEEEAARKANPRVESAFANRASAFGNSDGKPSTGGLFNRPADRPAATPSPAASSAPAQPATPAPQTRPGQLGGARGGSADLADAIQRRLQEKRGS